MGKSARVENARLAALRAQQARAERNRRLVIAAGTVGVVVLVVVGLVFAALQGANQNQEAQASSVLDQATFAKVTGVPTTALDTVGVGSATLTLKKTDAPALTKDNLPKVLYVGAEYCPYCAAQRWPLVVALSRFGTWNNLSASFSGPAPEVLPNTATVSFHGATYTSQYLAFVGYETATNKQSNGAWTKLDTLSDDDQAFYGTYNNKPYTDSPGIPWISLGGPTLAPSATYDGAVLQGKTQAEIAAALADPTSDIAKGIDGGANLFTAALCTLTNQQPTTVCTAAGVTAAAATLK
jgi:hypothetical protein